MRPLAIAFGVGIGIGVGLVDRLLVRPVRWLYEVAVTMSTPDGRDLAAFVWRYRQPLPERVFHTLDFPRSAHFDR